MSRSTEDSRRWVQEGTTAFSRSIADLDDAQAEHPTDLPGWTRKHLIAHVAANADALRNLARWARTGEESPMYSSSDQRNRDIEDGAKRPVAELISWHESSAAALEEDLDSLPDEAWSAQVRTAQGRTVPFSEVPWMRTREVLVHSVDLGTGVTWEQLPQDALVALIDDVVGKRSSTAGNPAVSLRCSQSDQSWTVTGDGRSDGSGDGDVVEIVAPVPQLAAYVAGRPTRQPLTTRDGAPAPELPAWL